MTKAAFKNKYTLFTSKEVIKGGNKVVKYCNWSIASYGAGNQTQRKVHRKYLESFKVWCWRRMEKII